MIINKVFIYPLYDIGSYTKYKIAKMREIVINLKNTGVDNIVLAHNLINTISGTTYEPLVQELKEYKITVLTSTDIPSYLLQLNPAVVDTRNLQKTYQYYLEKEGVVSDDGTSDICCTSDNIIDNILDTDSSEILDLCDIFDNCAESVEEFSDDFNLDEIVNNNTVQYLEEPQQPTYSSMEILMAMVNAKKKNKGDTTKNSKRKSKKILSLLEYTTKEIHNYLLDVKMILNINKNAICLNYINSYLPSNVLNLTVDSSSCNLKLGNNKIKASYINMKGVI